MEKHINISLSADTIRARVIKLLHEDYCPTITLIAYDIQKAILFLRYNYYVKGVSIVSDREYDRIEGLLRRIVELFEIKDITILDTVGSDLESDYVGVIDFKEFQAIYKIIKIIMG